MSADHELMTAAIARDLQQSFIGLMAKPARIGDIELKTAAVPPAARPCQPRVPASTAIVPF